MRSRTPGAGCTSRRAPFANLSEPLQYPPAPDDTSDANASPWTGVTPAYDGLYLRWLGLNLAVEIGGHVPWSVTAYADAELQILFDSASFLALGGPGTYSVCSGNPGHPNYVERKDNLGGSLIAPPRYTLAFLRNANLVAPTRAATIARLLDWGRDNLVHFYGAASYGAMEQHWQYRACRRSRESSRGRPRRIQEPRPSPTGPPAATGRAAFSVTSSGR